MSEHDENNNQNKGNQDNNTPASTDALRKKTIKKAREELVKKVSTETDKAFQEAMATKATVNKATEAYVKANEAFIETQEKGVLQLRQFDKDVKDIESFDPEAETE